MTQASFIIPVYNSQKTIEKCINSILQQEFSGDIEVIIINDGSSDASMDIVSKLKNKCLKIINQPHEGAVAATNRGIKEAKYDIICNIDSDVVLYKDWLKNIIDEFKDAKVGAVQGYFKTPKHIPAIARLAGYDSEKRYDSIKSKYVSHVSTGNTAYRRSAIKEVGIFDSRFKYAYDNDMSYRLTEAGYLLVFKKDAICEHYWKSNIKDYIRQQFWSGYGRMQVISKISSKFLGDSVAGPRMIMQVPLTLAMTLLLAIGLIVFLLTNSTGILILGLFLLLILFIDRMVFAIDIFIKQKDSACFIMPIVHLLRNLVWCWALALWIISKFLNKNK
jgi:cellulose synthase/poly-beta-1,6-N-acetylglucosamine synthase-like glycosyltransferase